MTPSRPPQGRAARRKAGAAPPSDTAGLRARLETATLKGAPAEVTDRARKMLLAYVDTAIAHGQPFKALVADLRSGLAAVRVGDLALHEQLRAAPDLLDRTACQSGCAFCCILNGKDGGMITEQEARVLHGALGVVIGLPDGRGWHPQACPALDTETRQCRAYDARPMICRTHVSTDADACRRNAEGEAVPGPGVLGAHVIYVLAQSLARAALAGLAKAPSYSLARVAAGAVAGQDIAATLDDARHAPRVLDDERARFAGSYGRVAKARR